MISARARDPPLHMHLDGAGRLDGVGRCCDSVQLCLSQGLGGARMGSVVTGGAAFVAGAEAASALRE